ncbi:hypothetical protein R1flu_027905 [Riccia fluitans]|uniref:Uncharacterized protein n=1 Tax=Riccia fluitans TaxID=41844 RepID=A0ABD1XK59_9MARC
MDWINGLKLPAHGLKYPGGRRAGVAGVFVVNVVLMPWLLDVYIEVGVREGIEVSFFSGLLSGAGEVKDAGRRQFLGFHQAGNLERGTI